MTVIMLVVREITDGKEAWRKTGKYTNGRELEDHFYAMKKEYPNALFHLVNCTTPTPPPADFEQSSSVWWCPYCAHPRFFYYDDKLEVMKCNVCFMTDRNFYVRKYNVVPERRHSTNDGE